jgi:hypothetical protein
VAVLLFSAQDCTAAGADDPACATVNQGDTSAPWPYTPKFGSPGVFPQGSFFEGRINITRLVPEAGCFTTFLAETRSSTPFDARLKDLKLGEFELCEITRNCPMPASCRRSAGIRCMSTSIWANRAKSVRSTSRTGPTAC